MLHDGAEPMASGDGERSAGRGGPMRGGRLVVSLWGRQWRRDELLARVGRLEQVAGMRLVEGGDGAERGVRLLRCSTGAGFEFEILVDRGFDVGGETCGLHGRYTGLPAGLPYDITWRQLGPVAYVIAMEPSPNRDAGRLDARARGELGYLAPGEERRYRLETGALDGQDAIAAFAAGARELAVAAA
jgi:hypothetical protein